MVDPSQTPKYDHKIPISWTIAHADVIELWSLANPAELLRFATDLDGHGDPVHLAAVALALRRPADDVLEQLGHNSI